MNTAVTSLAKAEARAKAYAMPLADIDMSQDELFAEDTIWPYFERLRQDAPIHYQANGKRGAFWSVTKYKDIMAVDTNHKVFSSAAHLGGITIVDAPQQMRRESFISMDPPRHDEQRRAVGPIVAPGNLMNLEALIRQRACTILDSLPRNETFNWVEKVSIELTIQMLATLFDFPFEERYLLAKWSDTVTTVPAPGQKIETWEDRDKILMECLAYFTRLWNERVNAPPRNDLVSMMAHAPATRNMDPRQFLGNLGLLIVGGNDTTRNSISGGVLFLNENPDEYEKLRRDRSLIPSAVSEIIRYQSPISHMRRTAVQDFVLGGQQIKAGDKVAMWYISGNRDSDVIPDADRFKVDRPNARQHLAFGFGVHRCVGNRLAEMQLAILWEEALKRFHTIEVVGDPVRVPSAFIHGIAELPVRIAA